MLRKRLGLLFGFVFIDLLGYSLILPLLPYYAEEFGATLTLIGLLGTSNALGQLVAAPVIGRLSDRYGRRPLLIVSIAGTFVAFLLLGTARSLVMLFVSRILDGLLGGNISLARAYITDVTDETNRAKGLGIIGAAFGLGFIIGPVMGGLLSTFGLNVPAFVAAGLSLLNLIAVVLWLPESLTEEHRAQIARDSPRTRFTFRALQAALQRPCVGPLLHVSLFYALAFTLFQSNFAVFAKTRLALTAQGTSYVLTYVGLLSVLVQGVAIGWMTKRVREKRLIFVATLVLAVSLLSWAFVPNVGLLLVVLAPIALSAGVLGTVLSSVITKSVYREEIGGTLGLTASIQTLAQILMPGLGGILLDALGPWALGVLGGALMLWTASFAWRNVVATPDLSPAECAMTGQPSATALDGVVS
ncbi:MAG: MFS transporter [Anaerolineae bacterium]|nr:MFS transporter [Anaerolineae bacterium]